MGTTRGDQQTQAPDGGEARDAVRDLETILCSLPASVDSVRCGDLSAVIELRFADDRGPRRFQLVIEGGRCRVDRQAGQRPSVTVEAAAEDLAKLGRREESGLRLMFRGRLSVSGNVLLASRLRGLFASEEPAGLGGSPPMRTT